MKPESPFFDSIRVARKPDADRHAAPCQWPGCSRHGGYRAPKGRRAEGEYHDFCLEHVKEYNKTYNYFAGMDEEAVRGFQKADATGHRPTWKLGQNSWAELNGGRFRRGAPGGRSGRDPYGLFGDSAPGPEAAPVPRALQNGQRKALESLGLTSTPHPSRSRRSTRRWSSGSIPTPMAAAGQWRTGSEKSFRPMIASRARGSAKGVSFLRLATLVLTD
jgi:hypothetical protein